VGKVSFIDPVTDATSNTVKVIVEVNNEKEQLRTGVRCIIKKQ
jgi:multidrug efflux pump subunit AcrA (membrane-fusion protein)